MADGTWLVNANSGAQYLYAIDLSAASAENLGQVNDSPNAQNSCVEIGNSYGAYDTEVRLLGCTDNRLILCYAYTDDQQKIIDALDTGDTFWDLSFPWQYELKTYDLSSHEWQTFDTEKKPVLAGDEFLVLEDSGAYPVYFSDSSAYSLPFYPNSYLNALFFGYTSAYDGTSDNFYAYAAPYDVYDSLSVCDYVDDTYIISHYDTDSTATVYERVSPEDLLIPS